MIIAGNWKMNMGFQEGVDFLSKFKTLLKNTKEQEPFLFFPPACLSCLFQKENFHWGGQNIHHEAQGAFTGENSPKTLKEMGAGFCLLGHSERRNIFGESDIEIEKKFRILQNMALIPVLCVGENKEQRSTKKTVLKNQLAWIKNQEKYKHPPWKPDLLPPSFQSVPFIIAYEPLWSIGTGLLPSPQEVDETLFFIKEELCLPSAKLFYGGSVDQKTVKTFLKCSNIDGFLIGGASLDPFHFYSIYEQTHISAKPK